MPEEKTDAIVDETIESSESSTETKTTPNDSEEQNKEDQVESGENDEKDDSEELDKPFHKIKRFREIIEEKNSLKQNLGEKDLEIEKLKAELYETKSNVTKPVTKSAGDSFSKFGEILDHGIEYKFKEPSKYESMTELYKDFRDVMFSELFYMTDKTNKETVSKETQEREYITKQLDDVDKYFGDDEDSKKEFYKDISELMEKNPKVKIDILDALTLYESIKPKKNEQVDAEKKQTLKAIGKGTSKPIGKMIGFDPMKDRNKSFSELASNYFN